MSGNKEKLLGLEKTGEYLFHGSPFKSDKLKLRQPFTFDKKLRKMVEDGKPAVVATLFSEIAVFRAIINNQNAPKNHNSAFNYNDNKLNFIASPETLEQTKKAKGYVYVLNKKNFNYYSPIEWRANQSINPIDIIEVNFSDLPLNISHSSYIKPEKNFAYIDGANLYNGIADLDWELDYKRFKIWLSEKYKIETAYIFIGLIPKYKELYKYLQESGFTLIFKEVVYDGSGKPKGNCDADLVLQTTCDAYENKFNKAIIITSDGDYAGLVKFLQNKNKLLTILSPSNEKKCSILLKRTGVKISYINEQQSILKSTELS